VESVRGREARVRVERPIPGGGPVLGELVAVKPVRLALPLTALWESGGRAYVFRLEGDAYVPRRVKLKARGEHYVEIQEGLAESDRVAASGLFWLEAEWRMRHPSSAELP
jgi:multidrug efflux pump subunit AcrA (membrane-fusion protein)